MIAVPCSCTPPLGKYSTVTRTQTRETSERAQGGRTDDGNTMEGGNGKICCRLHSTVHVHVHIWIPTETHQIPHKNGAYVNV